MDSLYRAYSCPMDLMGRYINDGRFGTFVKGFLEAEHKHKKEQAERDEEMMLWIAYVHSESNMTFTEWKAQLVKPASTTRKKRDADLTDDGIGKILQATFAH